MPIGWTGNIYCELCGDCLYLASDLELVRGYEWSVTNSDKRVRGLHEAGENVRWSRELNAWIWLPQPPPLPDNGLPF